jgi:hypothetical protein
MPHTECFVVLTNNCIILLYSCCIHVRQRNAHETVHLWMSPLNHLHTGLGSQNSGIQLRLDHWKPNDVSEYFVASVHCWIVCYQETIKNKTASFEISVSIKRTMCGYVSKDINQVYPPLFSESAAIFQANECWHYIRNTAMLNQLWN